MHCCREFHCRFSGFAGLLWCIAPNSRYSISRTCECCNGWDMVVRRVAWRAWLGVPAFSVLFGPPRWCSCKANSTGGRTLGGMSAALPCCPVLCCQAGSPSSTPRYPGSCHAMHWQHPRAACLSFVWGYSARVSPDASFRAGIQTHPARAIAVPLGKA